MQREVFLGGERILYTLRESPRAKYINLVMEPDGSMSVSLPKRNTEEDADLFIRKSENWILKHVKKSRRDKRTLLPSHSGGELELLKEFASIFVRRKIQEFNGHYNFPLRKISIKNTKSQWGSCSAKGNLSFSYKIVMLPERLGAYVVAHELCHLREFSHNNDFWRLLREQVPHCRKLDKELRRYILR